MIFDSEAIGKEGGKAVVSALFSDVSVRLYLVDPGKRHCPMTYLFRPRNTIAADARLRLKLVPYLRRW